MSASENKPSIGCGILLAVVSIILAIILIWAIVTAVRWLHGTPPF